MGVLRGKFHTLGVLKLLPLEDSGGTTGRGMWLTPIQSPKPKTQLPMMVYKSAQGLSRDSGVVALGWPPIRMLTTKDSGTVFLLPSHLRQKIFKEKAMADIENYMFENHDQLRQAATECMCNMVVHKEVRAGTRVGSGQLRAWVGQVKESPGVRLSGFCF